MSPVSKKKIAESKVLWECNLAAKQSTDAPNCERRFLTKEARLLVRVCWRLGKAYTPDPFPLSATDVRFTVGCGNTRARKVLSIFQKAGILKQSGPIQIGHSKLFYFKDRC